MAAKITTSGQDARSKGILPQGQDMAKYSVAGGANGPGMDPYPAEYAKLVKAFNNGKGSTNLPLGPSAPGPTSKGTPGNWNPQAKSYQQGQKSQPKVKEGP